MRRTPSPQNCYPCLRYEEIGLRHPAGGGRRHIKVTMSTLSVSFSLRRTSGTTRRLIVWSLLLGTALLSTLNSAAQQSAPEPAPVPPRPPGTLAAHPGWPALRTPSDADTVDHLVASLYDVISGPAGPRDWDRFRSLFLPDGRIGVVVPEMPATKDVSASKGDVIFLTPDIYARRDDLYFKTNGFFERSIANRVEEFGNLIHVWSTYESRHAEHDSQPFTRGINSIQIAHSRGRFWIASVLFDDERPGLMLPEKYLK
jgi:hypothetical protein